VHTKAAREGYPATTTTRTRDSRAGHAAAPEVRLGGEPLEENDLVVQGLEPPALWREDADESCVTGLWTTPLLDEHDEGRLFGPASHLTVPEALECSRTYSSPCWKEECDT